jgi:hypothetical protein
MKDDDLPRNPHSSLGILAIAIAVLAPAACTNAYAGMDLWRPPFHCVSNSGATSMTVLAEARFPSERLGQRPGSTIYRAMDVRRLNPGGRSCFRWPWASREGRINTVMGADTTWGDWFDPWGVDE